YYVLCIHTNTKSPHCMCKRHISLLHQGKLGLSFVRPKNLSVLLFGSSFIRNSLVRQARSCIVSQRKQPTSANNRASPPTKNEKEKRSGVRLVLHPRGLSPCERVGYPGPLPLLSFRRGGRSTPCRDTIRKPVSVLCVSLSTINCCWFIDCDVGY